MFHTPTLPVCISDIGLMTYSIRTEKFTDPTVKSVADQYFGVGERIFDVLQATAVNSDYFKRGEK